jgi:DNA polymerase elongation subunit (family B)
MYSFLSPIKTVKMWNQKESDDVNIDIAGSTILDYLELYKWYSPIKRERYTLDFISKSELSKGKVDYSEYNDLRQLYNDNWNLYVEYNIIDAYRVSQLEEKLGYIKLIQTLSLLTKVPMKYYRTQTTLIEGIFLTHFRRNGMCAPTFYGGVQESFEAAWVKEPQKGLYKWVSDLDITSSYPSAIITLNMSIETYYGRILGITEDQMMIYVKDRKFPNFDLHKDTGKININGKRLDLFNMALSKGMLCVAPCGSVFSTTTPGIISTVERIAFEKRIAVKRKMNDLKKTYEFLKPEELPTIKEKVARYHGLQNALKTILNSMYGATATPYSRYFNKNMSEAVVSCGRQTIKAANGFVNELLNNPTKELLDIFNEINT